MLAREREGDVKAFKKLSQELQKEQRPPIEKLAYKSEARGSLADKWTFKTNVYNPYCHMFTADVFYDGTKGVDLVEYLRRR